VYGNISSGRYQLIICEHRHRYQTL